MASKTTPAAEVEESTEERTAQQIVNDGILRVVAAHGIDVQKNRYKAMRAIAWRAFMESIEAGDFDELVARASANVSALPSGWEIVAPSTPPAVAKPAAKKAPAKRTTSTKAAR